MRRRYSRFPPVHIRRAGEGNFPRAADPKFPGPAEDDAPRPLLASEPRHLLQGRPEMNKPALPRLAAGLRRHLRDRTLRRQRKRQSGILDAAAILGVAALTLAQPFIAYLGSLLRAAEGADGWLASHRAAQRHRRHRDQAQQRSA